MMTFTVSQRPPSSDFFFTDASTPSPFNRIGSLIGSSSLSILPLGRANRPSRSYTRRPPARQAPKATLERARLQPSVKNPCSKKKRRLEGRPLKFRRNEPVLLRNLLVDPLHIPVHAQNLTVLQRLSAGLALIFAGLVENRAG